MTTALMLFAACAGESRNDSDSVVTEGETSGIVGADPTATTVADITDVVHPAASGEFVGALADVTAHTCSPEAGGWRVIGVVSNPTISSVDYRIFISLLNGVSTTRALVETEVLGVAGGGTGEFNTVIALPDDDLHCVLRVERRSPGN